MPPRLYIRACRPVARRLLAQRFYSAKSSSDSLVRVTNLEANGKGHIRIFELNRPEVRNAISRSLVEALRREIDNIQVQYTSDGQEVPLGSAAGADQMGPTRALIIASTSPQCFCAGADLKERAKFTPQETAEFLAKLRGTFKSLAELPIPTISAIGGRALGGGLELALATNFRVMASTATVGLPETRLGIIPGAGGTYRLPAIIGLSRARDMILTGRRVQPPEAYFMGLADRIVQVDPDRQKEKGLQEEDTLEERGRKDVLSAAVNMAHEICDGGPIAIRAALQAVNWANEDVENSMYDRVVSTHDRNEALAAFMEKRKPVFKGR